MSDQNIDEKVTNVRRFMDWAEEEIAAQRHRSSDPGETAAIEAGWRALDRLVGDIEEGVFGG